MRVSDITPTPTRIDEAPAGMIGQGLKRIGAKVAGAVGMKDTAAGLTGKAETGAEANKLMTALRGYLGKTGGNLKQLAADDLMNFLQQQGYPTDALKGVTGILPPAQVDKALLGAVQAKVRAGGSTGTGTAPSASAAPKASTAVPGTSAAPKASAAVPSAAPKSGAVPKASAAPKASAIAPKTSTGGANTNSSAPPDIMQQVSQLSAAQKKQLLSLLQ
jgi:hypothetical protein